MAVEQGDGVSVKDPGPPTWAEARDGHQLDRAKCADLEAEGDPTGPAKL